MDKATAARIHRKVAQLAEDPALLANNIKALKEPVKSEFPLMRLRIGDWRVIFRDATVLDILRVAPRGSAYG